MENSTTIRQEKNKQEEEEVEEEEVEEEEEEVEDDEEEEDDDDDEIDNNYLFISSNQNFASIIEDIPPSLFPQTTLEIKNFKKGHVINVSHDSVVVKIIEKKTRKIYAAKTLGKINPLVTHLSIKEMLKITLKMIVKQAKILSQISHPSIIKYIGFSPVNFIGNHNEPVIVTEYYKNGSLHDILEFEREGNSIEEWNPTMKLINIYGIASAILYLHQRNIIHRDINPSNVFVDDFLFPKLGDFGLAKFLNDEDDEQDPVGTPAYMSPEIYRDNKFTKASDVYAFGMTVYEILNGSNDFLELKSANIVFRIAIKNKRPELRENIPKIFQELIKSCWDDDPDKRPSIEDVVSKLRNNKEFITKDINDKLYQSYIDIIDDELNKIDTTEKRSKIFNEDQQTSIFQQIQSIIIKQKEIEDEEKKNLLKSLNAREIDLTKYEKICKIGSGGCGKIYKIRNIETKKIYVAKQTLNKKDDLLFLRELKIHSDVNHPSITKLIGYSSFDFEQRPGLVIVIEYISNGALERILLNERNNIKPKFWSNTMRMINIYGIASGISYLHSLNILHLDIKPQNALVDDFVFPNICDFGLSLKMKNGQRITMDIQGTASFIAPEIFKGETVGKEADVYAFGMLLYEMITKKYPFYGLNAYQISKIVTKDDDKINRLTIDSDIPHVYKKLIESCWNQDPNKRPTFEEILSMLRNNEEFIKNDVDSKLYHLYIDIIDEEFKSINKKVEQKQLLFKEKNIIQYTKTQSIAKEEEETKIKQSFNETEKEDIHVFDCSFLLPFVPLKISHFVKKRFIDEVNHLRFYKVYHKKVCKAYMATIFEIPHRKTNKEIIKMFSHQIMILSQISHPSIVKYIGYSPIDFENNNNPVIITEYCRNRTINQVLEHERKGENIEKWNFTKKLINIYGVASAMSYLHSQNILHRNINTSNILVDEFLFPKLGGFSLSKFVNDEDEESYQIDKKICNDEKFTKASDVFLFGITICEILTGQSQQENQIFCDNIPKIYQELIKSCCIDDPNKRPSFEHIVSELKNNKEYITNEVDSTLYNIYIEKIDDDINDTNTTSKLREQFPTFDLDSIYEEMTRNKSINDSFEIKEFMSSTIQIKFEEMDRIKKIYEDAYSSVYEYIDKKTKQQYSVTKSKYSNEYFSIDQMKIAKEVDMLSNLKHPSIQQFYGFVLKKQNKNRNQIISFSIHEYFPHKTLFDILEEERKGNHNPMWNNTNKMKIIYGIASGLSYLHSHQIKHLRLNPKNIFINQKFEVKLTEIGEHTLIKNSIIVSTSTSNYVEENMIYLSPEQINFEKEIPDKSDVYSYSLIVYEIITNDLAFSLEDQKMLSKLISKISDNHYRPKQNSNIPPFYQNLLEKCWSSNIDERPTFKEILYELENNPESVISDVNRDEYFSYQRSIKQFLK